jgi:hypothetical protein
MPIAHTRLLFERLCQNIPPLVPDNIQKDMSNALEQVQENVSLSLEELEDTVVSFGKKLWPYREAFLEFYRIHEGPMGETFLMQKLSPKLKKKYRLFKEMGGTFRDFHDGAIVDMFTSDDRVDLCEILVTVNAELWDYTYQKVLSTDRSQYEDRIKEFQHIFVDIEKKIEALNKMADDEQEHPEFAAEIREHVRGFEQGISLLGPKLGHDALCDPSHFEGRRREKLLLRGYL